MAISQRAICLAWYLAWTGARTNRQSALLALGIVLLGWPTTARAAEPEDAQARARQHFEAGAGHYAERRFRQALREFRSAAELLPSAELWFNVARTHEALGEHAEAAAHYGLYLRDRVDAPDGAEVRQRIADLRRLGDAGDAGDGGDGGDGATQARATSVALLRIDVDREGAAVMLDARAVGRSPLPDLVEITPGRHHLDVTKAGYLPFRAVIDGQSGMLTAAFVELTPRERAQAAAAGPRIWTWVAASVAGLALVGSGVAGALAVASHDDGDVSGARDRARASDVLLGSALVFGAASLVLHGLEGVGPHDQ